MSNKPKKADRPYVVVLAHADGWGALSANMLIQRMQQDYPGHEVHLIVSRATTDETGKIKTKLPDLEAPRLVKETLLRDYFQQIDDIYHMQRTGEFPESLNSLDEAERFQASYNLGKASAEYGEAALLTFNELAARYCADGKVHYTTVGGKKGGLEAEQFIDDIIKTHNGKGPEVLLSVDTMAILPESLLSRYRCFSAHPGPLVGELDVKGMQATLRPLSEERFYYDDGTLQPENRPLGVSEMLGDGPACLMGTLFMQAPELDKGPPIASVLAPISLAHCAYHARDDVYIALMDSMIDHLPEFLDKEKREALIAEATRKKEEKDKLGHESLPELTEEALDKWQKKVMVRFGANPSDGVQEAYQSTLIDPDYFEGMMRLYFPAEPGKEMSFQHCYQSSFAAGLKELAAQKQSHFEDDHWARYYLGDEDVTIRQKNHQTGKTAVHKNWLDESTARWRSLHPDQTPDERAR